MSPTTHSDSPDSRPSTSVDRGSVSRAHLLTVNVEDYFHVAAFRKYINANHWYRFESRLERNLDEALTLFSDTQTKATFFVLGWIAEKHPELIRRISQAGHEVASRGFLHQPLPNVPLNELRDDLRRSKAVLEDITGQAVNGFRLSDGWLKRDSMWLLNEVAKAGYTYDSSLMPRRRDFRRDPSRRLIHEVSTEAGKLLELPLSTLPFAGAWCPIAGGNYLRQFPDQLMKRAIDWRIRSEAAPFVMYFQIWELDPEQPTLSVSGRMTRMRHYRKLGKYRQILPEYLNRYNFTSVADHAARADSPLHSLQDRPLRRGGVRADCRCHSATANVRQRSTAGTLWSGQADSRRIPVTIVIPCFNEESSLPYLARTLEHVENVLSPRYQTSFLFVDDCSTDSTSETLTELFHQKSNVRIVRHDVNRGVSAAILTGIDHAETQVVCSMDCDCSYDPLELQHMLPLLTDDVAMVTASPYHRLGRVNNVPGWRLVLSRGLSAMYRVLLNQSLATWTSCFRVYRKLQIIDLPLVENGFLGTAELAAQLALHSRIIVEHPATLEVRLFGLSKMKTLRTIRDHLGLLARIARQKVTGHGPEIATTASDVIADRVESNKALAGMNTGGIAGGASSR
ncbi:MAG: glycosyltransferase [Planctomycetaceae bacterium]